MEGEAVRATSGRGRRWHFCGAKTIFWSRAQKSMKLISLLYESRTPQRAVRTRLGHLELLTGFFSTLHFYSLSDDTFIGHYHCHIMPISKVAIMAKTEKWPYHCKTMVNNCIILKSSKNADHQWKRFQRCINLVKVMTKTSHGPKLRPFILNFYER